MLEFILGIVFYAVVIPILEGVASAILSYLEVFKGKCAVEVAEYNHIISKMDDEPVASHVIGFQAPVAEEDDYEDD